MTAASPLIRDPSPETPPGVTEYTAPTIPVPRTTAPRSPAAVPPPAETPRQLSTPVEQDGFRETRYQLGTSQVTEREVTQEGNVTLYKRVAHHWGQVYYFQDGRPVDERVWKERFGDR